MSRLAGRVTCFYLLQLLVFSVTLQAAVTYKVRLSASEGGQTVELSAERYVAAVLAGEAGTIRGKEALKAMAIAARTYAAYFRSRHVREGFDFCSTTHCQRLILKDAAVFGPISELTHGQLLWFRSSPAFAAYTRDCGGRSEAGSAVWSDELSPYLQAHIDPYCVKARQGSWLWQTTGLALSRSLSEAGMQVPSMLQQITILRRTPSGRAQTLSLIGSGSSKLISASSFRFAVGRTLGWNTLRSDRYEVQTSGSAIRFEGTGQGHGVGLCQDGAAEMAAEGKSSGEILGFYYPGTTVSTLANDIDWVISTTHKVRVFAAEPNLANSISSGTDSLLLSLTQTYTLPAPAGIEVYIYPDLDSYRNGTGEPGWVAAHTVGTRIEMQPYLTLQQHGGFNPVLKHELLHVLVENYAGRQLPLWFQEGLVECLSVNHSNLKPRNSQNHIDDSQITARDNRYASRQAHAAAEMRVSELIERYGKGEVLRWVKSGIPEAVLRANRSNDATNSK